MAFYYKQYGTDSITRQALVAARRPIRLTPCTDEHGTVVPGWWTAHVGGVELRLRESRRARRLEPSRRVWIAADDVVLEERDVYFGDVPPVPPPDLSYTPRAAAVLTDVNAAALVQELRDTLRRNLGRPIDTELVIALQSRIALWSITAREGS